MVFWIFLYLLRGRRILLIYVGILYLKGSCLRDQDEDAMLLGAQFCTYSFSSILHAVKDGDAYSFFARPSFLFLKPSPMTGRPQTKGTTSLSRPSSSLKVVASKNSKINTPPYDLVDKLSNNGKQLDAIKFVLAFNLLEKYPPASLLKAYIKEIEEGHTKGRPQMGNNYGQSKNEAASREIAALKAVAKTVEEHNLGSAYPCENLQKFIDQLEKQKAEKKRRATISASSNLNGKGQKQQNQQPIKRPRLSTSAAPFSCCTTTFPKPASGWPDGPSSSFRIGWPL